MAKKVAKKRGRGGRKPGTWKLLTPQTLRAWREKNDVSRAKLGAMLSVSSTSVQNWETGHAVATAKMQQRLADLLRSSPTAAGSAPASTALRSNGSVGDPALVQATAAIVVEAIRAGGKGSVKDLASLIRA